MNINKKSKRHFYLIRYLRHFIHKHSGVGIKEKSLQNAYLRMAKKRKRKRKNTAHHKLMY